MLIDARTLQEDTLVETDICIIGAGAAGITLAQQFIDQPYQVCLLESGGLDFDEATQSLYAGENIGLPYFPLKEARARYLGGSTNLWGGWSRPLDEIDFEVRPWMPHSGWPFAKADLEPYYERAQQACYLGPYEYDLAYWKDALDQVQRQELPFLNQQLVTYLWQIIPQTHLRFGEVHRAEIKRANNIKTILHANVVEIETNETAQAVNRLRVATLDRKQFSVAAKVFILAAGGIENPRLLLASHRHQPMGVGNQYDLVGRFFMEHPYLVSPKLRLFQPARLYTQRFFQLGETLMGSALALSKAAQEREQILNLCARLIPSREEWLEAFRRLLQFRYGQPEGHQAFPAHEEEQWSKHFSTIRFKAIPKHNFTQDLGTVVAHLDRVANHLATKAYAKVFSKKKSFPNLCEIHLIGEQAPNPDSRIKLSNERDQLGLNRVQLDWRLSPIDKYTIKRSQQILAAEFERAELGKLEIELPNDDTAWQPLIGSYHHIGTTRMSTNPRQGVVNEHCQVHGINNLYVAGSSVFPTSGLSNPTLTIIALAIRLADHIKERMGDSAVTTKDLEDTALTR